MIVEVTKWETKLSSIWCSTKNREAKVEEKVYKIILLKMRKLNEHIELIFFSAIVLLQQSFYGKNSKLICIFYLNCKVKFAIQQKLELYLL